MPKKIKSDKEFKEKLTLYKEYLHQDWELIENKQIEKILKELDKEKEKFDKEKERLEKKNAIQKFISELDLVLTNQKYFVEYYLQSILETKKLKKEEEKDKSILKMLFTDDQLHSEHTFLESKRIFKERQKQYELKKNYQKCYPNYISKEKFDNLDNPNYFVFEYDTTLERYYDLPPQQEDYGLMLSQMQEDDTLSNRNLRTRTLSDFNLAEEEIREERTKYDRLESKITVIYKKQPNGKVVKLEREFFEVEELGRLRTRRYTNRREIIMRHRRGQETKYFDVDFYEKYEDILNPKDTIFRKNIEKISKLNIFAHNTRHILHFKEDSLAYNYNKTYFTKCRFTLMRSGKKYLDLHYGESPLHFYRIEILELTKHKLVFGECDNPNFILLSDCVYLRKEKEN